MGYDATEFGGRGSWAEPGWLSSLQRRETGEGEDLPAKATVEPRDLGLTAFGMCSGNVSCDTRDTFNIALVRLDPGADNRYHELGCIVLLSLANANYHIDITNY